MIEIRKSDERGHFNMGWLDTYHTFSFSDYYDPKFVHFRTLRVINEDRVAAGQGFGMHPHRDMEIITYILDGELEHKDSMGNGSIIRPGDVQRMSAGTGVFHSESNPSSIRPTHLLQIWIMPDKKGVAPSYEEKKFDAGARRGNLKLVASPTGEDGSVSINQDAFLYSSLLGKDEQVEHSFKNGRAGYIQVARGSILLNRELLAQGDGAAITMESSIAIAGASADLAEVLLFDLA